MSETDTLVIPRCGNVRIAREMGIGEENADVLERVAARRGLWKIESGV